MSIDNPDELEEFIIRIKEHPTVPVSFEELEHLYKLPNSSLLQAKNKALIQEVTDRDPTLAKIKHKRLSAVYNMRMHNKFFVPVWAAAMDADKATGYILLPQLTPLKDVLSSLRSSNEEEMHNVLRLCIAPIALAVDALHSHVPNKRTMYYHRDVCVDNVYMDVQHDGGVERPMYEDARLMLTHLSRGSHEDYQDSRQTVYSKPLCSDYYHHPDLREIGTRYHRRHDWYSFGVYILEVLDMVLHRTPNFSRIKDYSDVEKLKQKICRCSKINFIKPYVLRYIDIAVRCLKLQTNEGRSKVFELEGLKEDFMGCRRYQHGFNLDLEYEVSEWTAELLWMYDDTSRLSLDDKSEWCRACLLHSKDEFHTQFYSQAKKDSCDEECLYYCILCFTNGERLFCSNKHGPSNTVVGHKTSFALILYGESLAHRSNPHPADENENLFKKEAKEIAQVLQHKLIYGLDKDNIMTAAMFGDGQEDITSEQRLERLCQKMHEKIHGEEGTRCTNASLYTLLIIYCGHSYRGSDRTVGDWCPAFTRGEDNSFKPVRLKRAHIIRPLYSIRSCPNYRYDELECHAASVEIFYLSNPCGPSPGSINHAWTSDNNVSLREEAASFTGDTGEPNDLARWFCNMLRSLYYKDCCQQPRCASCISSRKDEHEACRNAKCLVPMGKIDMCTKLTRYIYEELLEGFIDGECLRHHYKHLTVKNRYRDLHVSVEDEYGPPILAYYNPKGVYLKVFSYRENMKCIEVDFDWKISCDEIISQLITKGNLEGKIAKICLLSTCSSDFSKYQLVGNHNLHEIIGSSILFYHVVSKPVQVTLRASTVDTSNGSYDRLYLALDNKDLHHIECESKWASDITDQPVAEVRSTQLPNMLLYVLHHLRYHLNEGGGTTHGTQSTHRTIGESMDYETSSQPSGYQRVSSESMDYERGKTVFQPVDTDEEDNSSDPMEDDMEELPYCDRKEVRNNFLEVLSSTKLDCDTMTPKDWEHVEGIASGYWRQGGVGVFRIRETAKARISIEWKRETPP